MAVSKKASKRHRRRQLGQVDRKAQRVKKHLDQPVDPPPWTPRQWAHEPFYLWELGLTRECFSDCPARGELPAIIRRRDSELHSSPLSQSIAGRPRHHRQAPSGGAANAFTPPFKGCQTSGDETTSDALHRSPAAVPAPPLLMSTSSRPSGCTAPGSSATPLAATASRMSTP